jgi:diguanylate cyclase (GGDEF)-like protein/PAS domain S-box-containing protein
VSQINSTVTVLLLENNCQPSESIGYCFDQIDSQKIKLFASKQLETGLKYLQQKHVDIIIINIDLSDNTDLNVIQEIYAIYPNIPLILITANNQENTVIQNNKLAIDYTTSELKIQDYLNRELISPVLLEKSIISILQQQQLTQLQQSNLELKTQLQDTQELFKTIVDTTSSLMWMIDADENYTFLNQAWLSFTGQTLETGLEENWRDRIHPEDLAQCITVYQSALTKGQGFEIEYRLRRFDYSYRMMLNTAVRRYNSQGEFAGFLCSCLDITQRKQIEQQVIQQAKTDRLLADITQKIHSSLKLEIIIQTTVEAVNQFLQAEKILITKIVDHPSLTDGKINCQLSLLFESRLVSFPFSSELYTPKTLPNQALLDNYDQLAQGEIIAQINNSVHTVSTITNDSITELTALSYTLLLVPIIVDKKLWGLLCVEHFLSPRYWQLEEIKLLRRVALQLEIAIKQSQLYQHLEQANQELEALAVLDGLTKIANRRKFDQYLEGEWKRLTRERSPLSLILCDIDYFKLYNDTYGHQAGDRCLQEVAQAISKVIKRPADLVARYGGEEFAVILPNTDADGVKYLARQIRLQIEALKIPHINSSVDLYVTISLGVASCIPNGGLGFYALVAAADKGLYQAKELGRNQVVEFLFQQNKST